jgi:pyruvate formate lyase activating enzyme
MEAGFPVVNKELCNRCSACLENCLNGAIALEGKVADVEQVLAEVRKDKVFYDRSGGGVTLSGGEVLLRLPFARELSRRLHQEGIHVAVETAGVAKEERFRALLKEIDYVMMDLKHYDSAAHRAGTRRGNEQVLANLRILRDSGVPFLVRIPVIPGFNDSLEDAAAFALLLKEMNIFKVQLLPFHRLGCHKYELLGLAYDYADIPSMQAEELEDYSRAFTRLGIEVII